MKDKIDIEKLFSDKLANHESVVSDQVWSGIQAQIGVGASSTAVAAKSISVATKWFIGIASVVAVSTAAIVLNYSETKTEPVTPNQNISDSTEMIAENKGVINEMNESIQNETATSADVVTTVKKSAIDAKQIQEKPSVDPLLNVSNNSEVLIVKQAVVPKSTDLIPAKIDKKNSMDENSKLTREYVIQLPVRTEVKGSVEAWKNTNIFSPNFDGVNDFFFLDCKDLKDFSISIINEKNAVVFISNDPNFKWDGSDYKTGEMVPVGNYGYIVFAVDINNNPIKLFNSLTVSK